MQVAFLAGIMYTLVGIFNLGFITNFISHTVISGFMSGAAVIIGLSQAMPLPLRASSLIFEERLSIKLSS